MFILHLLVEISDPLVNCNRRPDCPLGGILQRIQGTEKGQYPVTHDFVYSALVLVNLEDHDLKNLFHKRKSLFRAKLMSQRGESLHVTEHDGHLPALALNPILLSQDLLCKALWKVALDSR